MLEAFLQDVRTACRSIRRARAFNATAVLTLALGVSGTTVMFAFIAGVIIRPLPVREQEGLIVVSKELPGSNSAQFPFGSREIDAVSSASRLLESAAGVTRNGVSPTVMSDAGVSVYANVADVTGGFFDVLGTEPVLGRALAPADDKKGAENVIVLGNGFWRRRYGASRDIIGRRVTLDDRSFRIAGVMPADFDYPTGVEVWRTTSSVPANGPFGDAAQSELNMVARLRPGVTLEQATSEIVALSERIEVASQAHAIRGLVPVVRPFAEVVVGDVRNPLLALLAAVGLVMLAASANVANLLLMRAEARRGELALRVALGAGRGRILREILVESLIIAGLAGGVALAISWWGLEALIALMPDGLPRADSVRIDSTVVAFSIGIAFLAALLASITPAVFSMRTDPASDLRFASGGTLHSTAFRGRRALVAAQVAVAVTVIAAAGLLIQSVLKLQAADLGLAAERLVLLELYIPQAAYSDTARHARFLDELVARLETVPGVSAATPVNVPPFSGQGWDLPRFVADGQSADEAAGNPSLNLESIHPNYFETFQIPISRGRAFTSADREGRLDVAIVSEDLAARTWPGVDPVGRRLKMGRLESSGPWYTVVGVAGQTRYRDLTGPHPTLYLPAAQFQMTATMLVLRTGEPLDVIASSARDHVQTVDRSALVMRVQRFAEILDRPLARPRFQALLLGLFGLSAVLLSTLGVYAVTSAYVRQRHREIAIRLAMGATLAHIRRFVLAETVRLAGPGALIGAAGVLAANPLTREMRFVVDPLEPATVIGSASLLLLAAAFASYLPVRRATRVDAASMLRGE